MTLPVPKEIKKLSGTYRKDRDMDGITLPKLSDLPEPPEILTELGKSFFTNICTVLKEFNLLTGADLFIVTQLAQALEMNNIAYQEITNNDYKGLTYTNGNTGYSQQTAFYTIWDKTNFRIMGLSSLLGLNPSSREKIKAKPKDEDDALTLLMNKQVIKINN